MDSLISAAKVCDCVISACVDRYVIAWLNCGFAKIFCASHINIVLSVFSLADCTLEKQLSTTENWILV